MVLVCFEAVKIGKKLSPFILVNLQRRSRWKPWGQKRCNWMLLFLGTWHMKSLNGLLSGCPIPAFRAFRWVIDCSDGCHGWAIITKFWIHIVPFCLEIVSAIRAMEYGHILGIFLLEQFFELTPNVSDSVFHSCSRFCLLMVFPLVPPSSETPITIHTKTLTI